MGICQSSPRNRLHPIWIQLSDPLYFPRGYTLICLHCRNGSDLSSVIAHVEDVGDLGGTQFKIGFYTAAELDIDGFQIILIFDKLRAAGRGRPWAALRTPIFSGWCWKLFRLARFNLRTLFPCFEDKRFAVDGLLPNRIIIYSWLQSIDILHLINILWIHRNLATTSNILYNINTYIPA